MMHRVMHFASVINRYDFIDTVIKHADPSRFEMLACTFNGKSNIESPGYETAGIPHVRLNVTRRSQYTLAPVRLARLLRSERVQVLHTHHYDEAFIGVMAAKLARTPTVVIGRHYNDELYLLTAGAKLCSLLVVEGVCNRLARAIVVPSTTIRSLLVERQGVPAEKVWVIPYGFDFTADRYRVHEESEIRAIRRELGLEGAFVIGNFGRHHPLKGQDYLLRAFAEFIKEFPKARLLMVGDGPFHGGLQSLAEGLGICRQVLFTGWCKDASRLLGVVDVVVHPTLHEAFSQLMVESLAHRRPLIITDVSGVLECIEDGRTGIIVPRRDSHAIVKALRWVAEHREEARRLGVLGSEYIRETLDIRLTIRRYEACYEQVIGA